MFVWPQDAAQTGLEVSMYPMLLFLLPFSVSLLPRLQVCAPYLLTLVLLVGFVLP